MKVVNYAIFIAIVGFISVYTFNHINAWVGIGFPFFIGYIGLTRLIDTLKNETEK